MKREAFANMNVEEILEELTVINNNGEFSDSLCLLNDEDIPNCVMFCGIQYQFVTFQKNQTADIWPIAHITLQRIPDCEELIVETDREFLEQTLLKLRIYCAKEDIKYWEENHD